MSAESRAVELRFTIDDRERGDVIVDALLRDRLVACAQRIGPVASRYRWKGAIEQADEWLYTCKTTAAYVDAAIDAVRASHPYETPEIIVCEIAGGLSEYLGWIVDETAG